MGTVLAQLLVTLAASLAIGFVLGFTTAMHRRDHPTPTPTPTPDIDDGTLGAVVEREAALIEALARADSDLHARARELAIANEEITCLLEQLHEARHPSG